MNNTMEEYYKDLDFALVYEPTEFYVNFKCYEPVYWQDEKPYYEKVGSKNPAEDATTDLSQAQTYIEGSVKWDGCSHFTFGEDGYIHLCGKFFIEKHAAICKKIFYRCGELMNRTDEKEFSQPEAGK
jgi:hypothetical protein